MLCLFRYCFSFLRDEDVKFIQQLLTDAGVPFNVEADPGANEANNGKCAVKVKKEIDAPETTCDAQVEGGQAGVCKNHYKEYLTTLVKNNKVDPVNSYSLDECKKELYRNDIAYNDKDTLDQLRALIKDKIPLVYL